MKKCILIAAIVVASTAFPAQVMARQAGDIIVRVGAATKHDFPADLKAVNSRHYEMYGI
jgi:outer membrane protein W